VRDRGDATSPTPLRDRRRGVRALTPGFLAAVVFVLSAAGAVAVEQWLGRNARRIAEGTVITELSPFRASLQNAINQRMALLQGVAAYIKTHWDDPRLDEGFDRYSAQIVLGNPVGIRSIQYVVDGRIRHSWPSAGNEAAVGRDVLQDPRPEISGDLRRAMEQPGIILSGPTELYQGGRGLIGRLAVSFPMGSPSVVAAMVLDLPAVLVDARLNEMTAVEWQLVDHRGDRVDGSQADAVSFAGAPGLAVRLPDREWRLVARPLEGWTAAVTQQQWPVRVTLAVVVGLLTLLAWALAAWQAARLDVDRAETRRRAEEKFQLLFSLVPDGVVVVRDVDGMILECNEAYASIMHRARRDLVGQRMLDAGLWASEEERAVALERIRASGSLADQRFGIRLPDGSRREGMITATRVTLDGEPCYLSIVRDVHDRQALERRLTENQRLEAVGRLAGGIAHDFNNLVTGIAGYASLALEGLASDDPRRADLVEIQRASGRAADLTRQLLTFAGRQVVAPRLVDLNALVHEAKPFLQRVAGDGIVLAIEAAPESVPVSIDPSQFEQVLTNLAVNARDAMAGSGVLTITIGRAGQEAVLDVRDTGSGIPADAIPHIFEPFYTTKPQGQGTGLGLATVYGIVQQASGRVEVQSALGHGSTFRIRLPLADGVPVVAPSTPSPVPTGQEAVLVVEDEPQVRELARRVLERLGYAVQAASDGRSALALLDEGARPQLILTDMVMPGMGGGELLRHLTERDDPAKVMLMSGYSEELVKSEHGDLPFLPKPFTPAELAHAVRSALDG
jgi:PAS domain S-box-containing protein